MDWIGRHIIKESQNCGMIYFGHGGIKFVGSAGTAFVQH